MKKKVKKLEKEDIRSKINVLSIIEALENHIINGAEMSSTQVNAALALLKKTLPDMQEPKKIEKDSNIKHLTYEEVLHELE